jgi:hypothetical protein
MKREEENVWRVSAFSLSLVIQYSSSSSSSASIQREKHKEYDLMTNFSFALYLLDCPWKSCRLSLLKTISNRARFLSRQIWRDKWERNEFETTIHSFERQIKSTGKKTVIMNE